MNGIVNNLMIDLDNYLKIDFKEIYKDPDFNIHSYLWRDDVAQCLKGNANHIAFRHPGATNGHIVVDKDMIIKDIVFYEDTCPLFYEGNYQSLKGKYIGTKLSLEEVKECLK